MKKQHTQRQFMDESLFWLTSSEAESKKVGKHRKRQPEEELMKHISIYIQEAERGNSKSDVAINAQSSCQVTHFLQQSYGS